MDEQQQLRLLRTAHDGIRNLPEILINRELLGDEQIRAATDEIKKSIVAAIKNAVEFNRNNGLKLRNLILEVDFIKKRYVDKSAAINEKLEEDRARYAECLTRQTADGASIEEANQKVIDLELEITNLVDAHQVELDARESDGYNIMSAMVSIAYPDSRPADIKSMGEDLVRYLHTSKLEVKTLKSDLERLTEENRFITDDKELHDRITDRNRRLLAQAHTIANEMESSPDELIVKLREHLDKAMLLMPDGLGARPQTPTSPPVNMEQDPSVSRAGRKKKPSKESKVDPKKPKHQTPPSTPMEMEQDPFDSRAGKNEKNKKTKDPKTKANRSRVNRNDFY